MSFTASELEDRWRLLETAGPPTTRNGVQTAGVGVLAAGAEVVVAIDADGFRHVLVPLRGDQRLRRGNGDGTALSIRERPLDDGTVRRRYLDIGCLKTELNSAFVSVCVDVVDAVSGNPNQQVKATLGAIGRWRELFRTARPRLEPARLAGLFGEISLLIRLLEVDPSATACWTGPSRHRHDFTAARKAIEVKVSTTSDANTVWVHGLDQLDPAPGGTLDLMWLKMDHSDSVGESVPELVAKAMRLADDEGLLTSKLEAAGYYSAESASYLDARFTILDERWYEVAGGFPRLTTSMLKAAGLIVPVSDVRYTIDLAAAAGYRIAPEVAADRISMFTAGGA
ncbi:PD-(D/E)XK motif protein [Actinocrinis sp.]|uniref:PD-(D/E)XK motif protein n=1 Tax=Actinocrinis sp. TaxID=1920516 RepID=UPI0039C8554F